MARAKTRREPQDVMRAQYLLYLNKFLIIFSNKLPAIIPAFPLEDIRYNHVPSLYRVLVPKVQRTRPFAAPIRQSNTSITS